MAVVVLVVVVVVVVVIVVVVLFLRLLQLLRLLLPSNGVITVCIASERLGNSSVMTVYTDSGKLGGSGEG